MIRRILFAMSLLLMLPYQSFAQNTWFGNSASAATSFGGGSGTEADPFLITSCEEWCYFCRQESWTEKFYQLACDIYVSQDIVNSLPCAGTVNKPFDGTFDGNGHHIQISKYMNYLFGAVSGTVKNLAFSAIREKPRTNKYDVWYQGLIVSRLQPGGIVDNCYLYYSGSVYDGLSAFVLGQLDYGSIVSNTYITGSASVESPGNAKLSQYDSGCTYINCHSTYSGTPSTWENNTEKYQNCDKNVINRVDWRTAIRGNSDFTVTYHDAAGFIPTATQTYSSTTTISLPTPTSSCTFVGWYYKNKKVTTSTVSVNSDTDYYAYWKRGIKTQPTASKPTFVVEDSEHAHYQWYKKEAGRTTYSTWTSDNHDDNSVSSYTYTVNANVGQRLSIAWNVSSEDYDQFIIYINGSRKFNAGGRDSGTFSYAFPSTGTFTVKVAYEKDSSDNEGEDVARVTSFVVTGAETPLEGETSSELSRANRVKGTEYYCVAEYFNSPANIVDSQSSYTSNHIISAGNIYTGTCGDNLTWTLDEDGLLKIEGTGPMYDFTWNYETGDDNTPWYSNKGKITSVKISENVTSIGNEAFSGCTNLASIVIPGAVTSIGDFAFSSCLALNSISISNAVTNIGEYAFATCSSLTSFEIPNSLTSISDGVFESCSSLASIVIPNSVTSIGSEAFAWCSGLTTVVIPNSVTSIGQQAFGNSSKIDKIYIVDVAGWCNISGLHNLMGYGTNSKILFINNVEATDVVIPEGPTTIPICAFRHFKNIISVTIPNSVTSIGINAFNGCSALLKVTNFATAPQSISSNVFSQYGTLYVPASAAEAYGEADYWKNFTIIGVQNGDVNLDNKVNVTDAVEIVNNVVGEASERFQVAWSDVNNDDQHTIADAMAVVNIILGEEIGAAYAMKRAPMVDNDHLSLYSTSSDQMTLAMNNTMPYSSFQFDVKLPEGITLENVTLNQNRCQNFSVMFREIEEGRWTVAVYNLSNLPFATGSGSLLDMTLSGHGDLSEAMISNIHFSTTRAADVQFEDMMLDDATGIERVNLDTSNQGKPSIYDLSGRRLNSTQRGVNIVNGKKIIIK